MYLKALEIQGFKSFPDKTILQFSQEMTAIVGPNGSGKSNISDAIRWVCGEQSAKDLRGAKMEDVIFSGTKQRAPVGFAQVTLIIDNTGHVFPNREESEVSVTRRYYRSGDSEYYINRQAVRLRDVTELFMDTGMGREGYSIIGQGRIDEILSTKSGDRRNIFEEAAGISKFRHRKEEAERKLARTEENLIRIHDKISELELQIEPLREQAEQARRYLILRDELRLLEVSLWLENLDQIKQDTRKLKSSLETAVSQCDQARADLDAFYSEDEQYGEQMREKDIESESIRNQISSLENQVAEQERNTALLTGDIAHQEETIVRIQNELEESGSRSGNLKQQSEIQEARAIALAEKTTAIQNHLNQLLEQVQAITQQLEDVQNQAENIRAQENNTLSIMASARAQSDAAASEIQELTERRTAVEQEQNTIKTKQIELKQTLQANQSDLEDTRKQSEIIIKQIAAQTNRIQTLEQSASNLSEQRVRWTVDIKTLDSRIRLLTDMEREYQGFSKSVRLICQSNLPGIHGPVANLIKTDKKYSLAIEMALGAGLQNLVVDREEDAKNAIQFLKQKNAGRATFLPLTAIHSQELQIQNLNQEAGFINLASRLIQFDLQYQSIIFYLLGRTVITENLDSGIAIARKYRNAFRIVTLDGQIINRGGSMTGGSINRSTGVLSRSLELEQLRIQSVSMHEKFMKLQAEEEQANQKLVQAREILEAFQNDQHQLDTKILQLENIAKQSELLFQASEETQEHQSEELKRLDMRLSENQARFKQSEQVIAEQEIQAENLRIQNAEILSGQSKLLDQSSKLSEIISDQKSQLAALQAERDSVSERAIELRRLSEELSSDRTQKENMINLCWQAIKQAQTEVERFNIEAKEFLQQRENLQRRLSEIQQEKLALEAERSTKNRAGQQANENLLNLERSAAKLEQKLTAKSMEEKQILDRLWEHYELSHSDASAIRQEIKSIAKTTRRIGELKREMQTLEPVNLGAIPEYERVNTRYTYFTDQKNDIEMAKQELTGIIQEITSQMIDIFSKQFGLLQDSFQNTFVELFGGGQATLELEDPHDILNCGIEIKAQPPGKTLKTISLLSGGEKAFVAIALYFSILKVHPTPFCVMDEIEAALDDINVSRCARYMRKLSNQTQFIIITHRRGTMEAAGILYGVTMQEQGVSKILTMNLDDIAQELKLEDNNNS